MIKMDKPTNLNGIQLLEELKAAGITVNGYPLIDGLGDFYLDVKESDKVKAAEIVKVHNGNTVAPESSVADKLMAVGLSLEDLKAAINA